MVVASSTKDLITEAKPCHSFIARIEESCSRLALESIPETAFSLERIPTILEKLEAAEREVTALDLEVKAFSTPHLSSIDAEALHTLSAQLAKKTGELAFYKRFYTEMKGLNTSNPATGKFTLSDTAAKVASLWSAVAFRKETVYQDKKRGVVAAYCLESETGTSKTISLVTKQISKLYTYKHEVRAHCRVAPLSKYIVTPLYFDSETQTIALPKAQCTLSHIKTKLSESAPPSIVKEEITKHYKSILSGLIAVHEIAKQVHGDIKPCNILMFVEDGTHVAKIADWGSSYAIDTVYRGGTDGFAAPELEKKVAAKPSRDMWSVGVSLCISLFGVNPFKDKSTVYTPETQADVETLLCSTFEKLSDYKKAIDPDGELRAVILDLLRFDPTKRLSAREALARLETITTT